MVETADQEFPAARTETHYNSTNSPKRMNSSLKYDSRPRLRVLDGWRAVSVLLVIVHHIGAYQHARPFLRIAGAFPLLENWGPLGVKVFFVISGFVICRLLVMEEQLYGSISLRGFYYRRATRILPSFYLYLAVISLLAVIGLINVPRNAILASASFLFNLRHVAPSNWFVGHTWSLAVEEQFYLIFPCLLIVLPRLSRPLAFAGLFFLISAWDLSLCFEEWESFTSSHTREGFVCICSGVLSAIHEMRLRAAARRFPAWAMSIVAAVLLLYPPGSTGILGALYQCFFVPPAIALLLFFSLERGPVLHEFLCSRPMQAIGVTSYGIYLWQQLFTAPAMSIVETGPRQNFSSTGHVIPLLFPLLFVIVPLSFVFVEKPAMRLGRLLSGRARKPVAVRMDPALSVPSVNFERGNTGQ
jgi:peptidoglycan/LPS O-acetylase OafA/YrhL